MRNQFIILSLLLILISCSSDDNPVDKNKDSDEKILFHQKIGGKYQIFSMNPDGSDKSIVIERENDCTWAKYSPDKSKIAFTEKYDDEYSFTFLVWMSIVFQIKLTNTII